MAFCSGRERSGSTQNTTRISGDLKPRGVMGISKWKITKRKLQG